MEREGGVCVQIKEVGILGIKNIKVVSLLKQFLNDINILMSNVKLSRGIFYAPDLVIDLIIEIEPSNMLIKL